jgi:hypothetical protein
MSLQKLTIHQIPCIISKSSPPLFPSLKAQMKPVKIFKSHFFKIHLHLDLPTDIFTSSFLTKILHVFIFYHVNSCFSTGIVEMIWTALAQDTPYGIVFNILILLQSQHSCANLLHITYFFHNEKHFCNATLFRKSMMNSGIRLYKKVPDHTKKKNGQDQIF